MDQAIADLGNEPPLIADGRSGPPDRREVSARWLSGTFLTGITSSVLMGVALFAALDVKTFRIPERDFLKDTLIVTRIYQNFAQNKKLKIEVVDLELA